MNMTKISNLPSVQGENQKKTKNKGVIRGYMLGTLASAPVALGNFGAVFGMRKLSEIGENDSFAIREAASKALENSGLAQKGVEIITVKEEDLISKAFAALKNKNIRDIDIDLSTSEGDRAAIGALANEVKENKLWKFISKLFKDNKEVSDAYEEAIDSKAKQVFQQIKIGLNACFIPNSNKILVPDKHLQTSVFHEIGHAMNANGSVFLKALQKCRPLAKFVPAAVLLISLLNKRPKKSEKLDNTTTKNKLQNTADVIKDNAGLITGLSMLPMLLEEGIASLRGQNLAKNLVKEGSLSKELFKKIKLTNLGGFASYATAIAAAIVTCEMAIKIKDKIQKKHEAKVLEKVL